MKGWEEICTHCGLCCHEKVRIDRKTYLIYPERACEFLGEENLCTVYEKRFAKCKNCRKLTLIRAMFAPWLPPSCAYVQWAIRHHIRFAPKRDWVIALDESSSQ